VLLNMGVSGLPKYGSEDPICWYHTPVRNIDYLLGVRLLLGSKGRQEIGGLCVFTA
ncbi:MAG: hypothetical protein RL029_860, partial [Actinomycetota bacterium]